uniref:Reticulophagy regulator 1 n=1 Tax=Pundamilia nyererei TaxID=303518 RepID=A0A3B4GTA7_9CICH
MFGNSHPGAESFINHQVAQNSQQCHSMETSFTFLFPSHTCLHSHRANVILDSTVCKEMSVSDTEVSDVTWTDNGTFNLSEGHTPQTENSEDFDREEPFIGGLLEFPSLDNGMTTNGDDDDDLSLGLASPPTRLQDPIKSKHEPQDQSTNALDLVNQMAGEVITAAVTAAIQERIEAALTEESDSEVEDFELLDQSELEQLEGELGLGEKAKAKEEVQTDSPASSGFLSKLLKRH